MKAITFFLSALFLAANPIGFEVASIRPDRAGGSYGIRVTPGGRLTATNVTPLMLIRRAFDVEIFQLADGPAWLDSERYDVEARTADSLDIPPDELRRLLQTLLADRFALKVHREIQELPVYSLVTGKKGPALAAHVGDDAPSVSMDFSPGKAVMIARNTSMAAFARALSRLPGRPVNDNTGLRGTFDFTLEWSPDQTEESTGASLFTAIQEQLGLKLESTKGPVEVIVIDHVERPSEN